jgi:hypothetical protein
MNAVPEDWLSVSREHYVQYFVDRLEGPAGFVEEAIHAHAKLV